MNLPQPGEKFEGRYRIDAVLGEGGSGVVLHAVDEHSERDVALKIIAPDSRGYTQETLRRFDREVRILGSLRGPHTVTMYDHGRSSTGLLYFVFEYIDGHDLEELILGGDPLPEKVAIHILRQILESLHEAHSAGLLHRDVKPVNIRVFEFLGDPHYVKLIDFGIARSVGESSGKITIEGSMVGTPQFMAPEQILAEPLSPATDIYSLGLVTYEMLTGKPAVDAKYTHEIFQKHLSDERLLLPHDADVSFGLRQIIERMVARDPRDRFAAAEDVLAELDRLPEIEASPTAEELDAGLHLRRADTFIEEPNTTEEFLDLPEARAARGARTAPERVVDRSPPAGPFHSKGARVAGALLAAAAISGVAVAGLLVVIGEQPTVPPQPEVSDAPQRASIASMAVESAESAEEEGEREPEDEPGAMLPDPATVITPVMANALDSAELAFERSRGAVAGCGAGTPGTHEFGFEQNGQARGWAMYAPTGYTGREPTPVVLMIHDIRHKALTHFVDETNFRANADKEGYLVLSLLGGHRGALTAQGFSDLNPWKGGALEVQYLQEVLSRAARSYCLDPDRIFAIGQGAGGTFVEKIRCALPLRAIATNANRNTREDYVCTDGRAVPHLHFAGRADEYMPLPGTHSNCMGQAQIPLETKSTLWRMFNGCTGTEKRYVSGDGYVCKTWSDCREPYVECIHDWGHDWPETKYPIHEQIFARSCLGPPMEFAAEEVVWKFFAAQSSHAAKKNRKK